MQTRIPCFQCRFFFPKADFTSSYFHLTRSWCASLQNLYLSVPRLSHTHMKASRTKIRISMPSCSTQTPKITQEINCIIIWRWSSKSNSTYSWELYHAVQYSLLCYVQSLFILLTTVWPFHTNLPPFPTPGGIGCDIKLPWKTECCVGHLAIENKDIARLQEKNLPWSITWFRKSGSVVAQLSTHHTSYIWKTMVVWMTLAYQNLSSTEPSMMENTDWTDVHW